MTLRSLKVEGVSAFCKQGMMFYMKRTPDNIIFAKPLDRPAVRSNGRLVQLKAFFDIPAQIEKLAYRIKPPRKNRWIRIFPSAQYGRESMVYFRCSVLSALGS